MCVALVVSRSIVIRKANRISVLVLSREEPFEPLQEEDYDDPEVQIELKEAMEV